MCEYSCKQQITRKKCYVDESSILWLLFAPGCVVNKVERPHGDVWTPPGSECSKCLCSEGTVTCDRIVCNCTDPKVDLACCPQCDPRASCSHQIQPNLTFNSGQRWIYQCQTCECLVSVVWGKSVLFLYYIHYVVS